MLYVQDVYIVYIISYYMKWVTTSWTYSSLIYPLSLPSTSTFLQTEFALTTTLVTSTNYSAPESKATFSFSIRFGSRAIFLSQQEMAQVSNSPRYRLISASEVFGPTLSLTSSWHWSTQRDRVSWNRSSSLCTYCWALWVGP